jgi:hypothetical protein
MLEEAKHCLAHPKTWMYSERDAYSRYLLPRSLTKRDVEKAVQAEEHHDGELLGLALIEEDES